MNIENPILIDDKDFNWITALKYCIANPHLLTKVDQNTLYRKAGNWPSCACGQLCKALPRSLAGRPLDSDLARLGLNFFTAISGRNYEEALRVLHTIEKRTTELLNEHNKQRQHHEIYS